MLGKKTYRDHAVRVTVKTVGKHQMYMFMLNPSGVCGLLIFSSVFMTKGAFGAMAVTVGTFRTTSFWPEIMELAEDKKLECFIALMALFAVWVAMLWSLYPA